jgi:hypothetical protein
MSAQLYAQVQRLYTLLDLDGNGRLDRDEARLGFSTCFADVHRTSASSSGPDGEFMAADKANIVEQQVTWLFSATDHAADGEISFEDFKSCYAKLLAAAYEEEVLLLDLKRAIDSLSSSPEWRAMQTLFQTARTLFRTLANNNDSADATIQPEDPRVSAVLQRAFQDIQGRSQVLGPKKQTAARRLLAPALFSAGAPPLSMQGLVALYKQVLAVPVPVEQLAQDAQAALQLARGEAAAAAPAAAAAAVGESAAAAAPTSAAPAAQQ